MNLKIKYSNSKENLNKNLNKFLSLNNYSSIFVLLDENIKKYCLNILDFLKNFTLIEIQPGEKNKNLKTCEFVFSKLLENNADRNSLLINFGGGVLCDLGAFIASVYKRGIDYINIPTTVLSQVDASIGGKTGVNFSNYKNIIGTFSSYNACFIDSIFFKTLNKREIKNGFSEIFKHGLILDKDYFNYCVDELRKFDLDKKVDYDFIIKRSIKLKNYVVEKDFKELGLRKILNFGHTIGHALEAYSNTYHKKNILKHGEAVILGMICSLELSKNISKKEKNYIVSIFKEFYSDKIFHYKNWDIEIILNLIKNDKKNNASEILFVLLDKIGRANFNERIEEKQIKEVLNIVLF